MIDQNRDITAVVFRERSSRASGRADDVGPGYDERHVVPRRSSFGCRGRADYQWRWRVAITAAAAVFIVATAAEAANGRI